LLKSVAALPVRGFLSARILNALAALSLLCVLLPIVFLMRHESFNWIGTLLVWVLLTLGVTNRLVARRILRYCEALQQESDTVGHVETR
jgi:ABC-type protease/lipase transport system fused ATPase/permease subunit